MKLIKVGDFIEALPGSLKERSLLKEFPGFTQVRRGVGGVSFLAVSKPLVVQNLVRRLKALFKTLEVDREVFEMAGEKLRLKDIPEDFHFHTTPVEAQRVALRFLYTLGSAGILAEPGMGKTKVFLDYIHLMGFRRSIVVCPVALLGTWGEEAATHRPELSVHVVRSTKWVEELPRMREAQLVVINYDKAVALMEGLRDEIHFDAINVDEGLIKNPSTSRTQAITEIGSGIKHRVISSGTLINNSPLDLFAPVRFVEPSLVGSSYSKFKSRYAIESKPRKKADGSTSIPFVVGYRNVAEMRDILESCSIVMTKAQWLKLPPKTFKVIRCVTSEEQKRVFADLQSNYQATFQGKSVEVPSPLVLAAKQCQVANGFVYWSESADLFGEELSLFGEDQFYDKPKKGKKGAPKPKGEILFFDEQPKIKAMLDLLKGQLASRRVVMWYNLKAERKLIEDGLTEAGIKFLTIAGGEKDTSGKVKTFNRDSSFQVLLCQARAVNYGVTVLGNRDNEKTDEGVVFGNLDSKVFTEVFYSLNFSLEVFLQQQDRVHRIGQTQPCEYYILLSDFDVESYIYSVLESKKSVKESMMVDFVNSRKVDR